jgi:hypothetical protein
MIAQPNSQLPIPARTPSAYGYGRQSHRDQIDANEVLPQQGVRTKAYFTAQLEPLGVKWGGFMADDSAVSARTNPFLDRLAGKALFMLLQPGELRRH